MNPDSKANKVQLDRKENVVLLVSLVSVVLRVLMVQQELPARLVHKVHVVTPDRREHLVRSENLVLLAHLVLMDHAENEATPDFQVRLLHHRPQMYQHFLNNSFKLHFVFNSFEK